MYWDHRLCNESFYSCVSQKQFLVQFSKDDLKADTEGAVMEAWSSVFHSLMADGKKIIFIDVGACVWNSQFELVASG